MAIFVGYGDESGKQDDPQSTASAYGILIGPDECWDLFDSAWNEALSNAGIEYFHKKEFGIPNGPYTALESVKEQQLYVDFIEAIKAAGLEAYATSVRHAALAAKPKPGDKLSKVPGYQAADFLAWEARKYIHVSSEDERQRAADGMIRPMSWPPPRRRKSLHALNEARPIRGTFWDMEVLENEHKARGGIWKP